MARSLLATTFVFVIGVFLVSMVKAEESKVPAKVPAKVEAAADAPADNVEHTYFDEFVGKVKQGGLTMYILLVLSVGGIAKILERLFNVSRKGMATPGLSEKAHGLYTQGKYDELTDLCKKDKSVLGRIILAITEHRECSNADIQSVADDIGSRELRIQMQASYPLAIIATISPLLGLFGTVIGMIGAFDTVAQLGDMGNASVLADDIAKALVTTGGGLAVAIPMLGAYHYFRNCTNKHSIHLEEQVGELYSAWFLRAKPAAAAAKGGDK